MSRKGLPQGPVHGGGGGGAGGAGAPSTTLLSSRVLVPNHIVPAAADRTQSKKLLEGKTFLRFFVLNDFLSPQKEQELSVVSS